MSDRFFYYERSMTWCTMCQNVHPTSTPSACMIDHIMNDHFVQRTFELRYQTFDRWQISSSLSSTISPLYIPHHPFGLFFAIRPFEPRYYSESVKECFDMKKMFCYKKVMLLVRACS